MATRTAAPDVFGAVATALLQRYRLRIDYHNRGDDQRSQRIVSPQRLTHYRDNWYLDAWCHRAEGLRSFTLDRIRDPRRDPDPIQDLTDAELDAHFATAYGIFAGLPDKTAVLEFTAYRARWVADERWHPQQQGRLLPDGRYRLEIPYHRADELILDILRYGPDVEVLAPAELRQAVAERLQRAAAIYFSSP
jgi:predicted DNA-binding transcriptional regulator YafY